MQLNGTPWRGTTARGAACELWARDRVSLDKMGTALASPAPAVDHCQRRCGRAATQKKPFERSVGSRRGASRAASHSRAGWNGLSDLRRNGGISSDSEDKYKSLHVMSLKSCISRNAYYVINYFKPYRECC